MDEDLRSYLAESNEALLTAVPTLGADLGVPPVTTHVARPTKTSTSTKQVPPPPPQPVTQTTTSKAQPLPPNSLPLIPEIVLGPPPSSAVPVENGSETLAPPPTDTPGQRTQRSGAGGGVVIGFGLLAMLAVWWMTRDGGKAPLSDTPTPARGPAPVPVAPFVRKRKAK